LYRRWNASGALSDCAGAESDPRKDSRVGIAEAISDSTSILRVNTGSDSAIAEDAEAAGSEGDGILNEGTGSSGEVSGGDDGKIGIESIDDMLRESAHSVRGDDG
jgi:hypothetical protein